MNHDLVLEGPAYRLRPVTIDDAEFITKLRSDPIRGQFLHRTSGRVQDQLEWIKKYLDRDSEYYFIIESRRDRRREGTIGIYNVNKECCSAEWGRWIIREGSMAAIESVLLIYRLAMDRLSLNHIYSRTVVENEKVVSFHKACGLETATYLSSHFKFGESTKDAIEQRLTRALWGDVHERLTKMAERLARRPS